MAPGLADRAEPVAGLMRSVLLALALEHLALGPDDARATARIDELVARRCASTEPSRRRRGSRTELTERGGTATRSTKSQGIDHMPRLGGST